MIGLESILWLISISFSFLLSLFTPFLFSFSLSTFPGVIMRSALFIIFIFHSGKKMLWKLEFHACCLIVKIISLFYSTYPSEVSGPLRHIRKSPHELKNEVLDIEGRTPHHVLKFFSFSKKQKKTLLAMLEKRTQKCVICHRAPQDFLSIVYSSNFVFYKRGWHKRAKKWMDTKRFIFLPSQM